MRYKNLQIRFWGGPLDGEVIYRNALPPMEFICSDSDFEPIDVMTFYNEIESLAIRTRLYHKYQLHKSESNSRIMFYVYSGVS